MISIRVNVVQSKSGRQISQNRCFDGEVEAPTLMAPSARRASFGPPGPRYMEKTRLGIWTYSYSPMPIKELRLRVRDEVINAKEFDMKGWSQRPQVMSVDEPISLICKSRNMGARQLQWTCIEGRVLRNE